MYIVDTDSTELAPLRVIGVGSPFGADRLGWDVIKQLLRRESLRALLPDQLSLLHLDRPGAALLDYLSGAERVIILDAMKTGGEPGSLLKFMGEDVGQAPVKLSSHGFGLRESLNLARVLNEAPDETWVMGVEIGDDECSSLPDHWVGRLTDAVESEILQLLEPA